MQNGTQDSLTTHNVSTQGEFPAEIASWLMLTYLNQVQSFQKLASWIRNLLTLLDIQILITRLLFSILPKMLECESPEEEAVKLASVQVASEKQAVQHGPN